VGETDGEREDGALSGRRLDGQLAAVGLDNSSRDGQAEPRTAAGLTWLEGLPAPLTSAASVGAGLLGARDGIEALRIALGARQVDLNAVKRLADQLARISPPDPRV